MNWKPQYDRRYVLWGVVGLLVCIPAASLWWFPDEASNPIIAFTISVIIAAASVIASRKEFVEEGRSGAQKEWLYQAESACDRLLTVSTHVRRMHAEQTRVCGQATDRVPELQNQELTSVRLILESNCSHIAGNLQAISDDLDSAFSDWNRFIRENCRDDECKKIGSSIEKRRAELAVPLPGPACNDSPQADRATSAAS